MKKLPPSSEKSKQITKSVIEKKLRPYSEVENEGWITGLKYVQMLLDKHFFYDFGLTLFISRKERKMRIIHKQSLKEVMLL